ncbi:uncharacterized protein LOC108213155 isoform X4 [Daucus carota subsp. sativus]|uniref:uncharacterized protein LOC108213155 isoform X4 n=1 Tax=Daucus carota subsp. sativus TaxID=79200 RepID=UPI003083A419
MFWKGEGYLSGGKILGKLGNKVCMLSSHILQYICIWQALGYGKKLEYLFANTNGEQKQARKMNMLTDLQNIGIFVETGLIPVDILDHFTSYRLLNQNLKS